MSATDALSPQQFYHGTNKPVEGDVIDPSQKHERTHWMSNPSAVYFTSDPVRAHFYADRAVARRGGEPHVTEVEPTGYYHQDLTTRSPENFETRHPLRVMRA